jgi:hypothetical protein
MQSSIITTNARRRETFSSHDQLSLLRELVDRESGNTCRAFHLVAVARGTEAPAGASVRIVAADGAALTVEPAALTLR